MVKPVKTGSCKKKCPGGYQCNCENSIEHTLHICKDPDCWCHAQGRYEGQQYDPFDRRRTPQ